MGEQWQSSFKYRGVNRVSICKNFAQCLRKKAKSLLSLRYIFFAKNSTLRNHSHTSIRAKLLFSAFALFLFAILILFNSQTRLKLLILVKLLIGKNYALRNTSGFVEITPKNCANTRKTSQKNLREISRMLHQKYGHFVETLVLKNLSLHYLKFFYPLAKH